MAIKIDMPINIGMHAKQLYGTMKKDISAPQYRINALKWGIQMDQKKNSYEKIYDVVKQIPRGNVATYGQVAALAGNRRWARVVGYALHVNPDPEHIPCHRVVNREGRLSDAFAFGGVNRQQQLLEAEGVSVVGSFVDLEVYQWKKVVL